MKKDTIETVLDSLVESIGQENVALYKAFYENKTLPDISTPEEFDHFLVYPHQQFLQGLIAVEISTNRSLAFILMNYDFVEQHFLYWITAREGSGASADKSRTILKHLVQFFKTGKEIVFDYTQEYTFHLPKKVFTEHEDILGFYKSLETLFYENPTNYLKQIQILADIVVQP